MVYRLESITDLALLPESELSNAIASIELVVLGLRAQLAAIALNAPDIDAAEAFEALGVQPYVEWVADGVVAGELRAGEGSELSLGVQVSADAVRSFQEHFEAHVNGQKQSVKSE